MSSSWPIQKGALRQGAPVHQERSSTWYEHSAGRTLGIQDLKPSTFAEYQGRLPVYLHILMLSRTSSMHYQGEFGFDS